jgi:hypothetical protein
MERPSAEVDSAPADVSLAVPSPWRRRLVSALLVAAAACCYVGVVSVRLGPATGRDTAPLTAVTTAIADGDLRVAASITALPDPPGYPLLAAPFVAAFGGVVGSPSWCTPVGRFGAPGPRRTVVVQHALDAGVPVCGRVPAGTPVVPPWYRSQGLLGVATWLVLALGALALLRAGGADSLGRQSGLLAFLVVLPAASSAMVQLFHPQDVVSLGLGLAGLAQTLRSRWWLAGALFGAAMLTKQFALLLLIPALVVAPGARSRFVLGGSAVAVFVAGLLPFAVVAPRAMLENVSGYSGGGASAGQTVLTLAGVHGAAASAVARDVPVLFAVGFCLWAATRRVRWAAAPAAVVGLALACAGSRLVFESVIFPYYLLSASVLVLLVDLVARRSPARSLAWCAAAAFFVAVHPGNRVVAALGTLVLAVAVVLFGLGEVDRAPRGAAVVVGAGDVGAGAVAAGA